MARPARPAGAPPATTITEATASYERWLAGFMELSAAQLRDKHRLMGEARLPFLRATFYRWCQLWLRLAGAARRTTRVLAIADLHVENFGTWRDADGRLIWGVNDFDEVAVMPWTNDLARLCASAHMAVADDRLSIGRRDACDAVLEGYAAGIAAGGRAFVLEEQHGWLRRIATGELRDPRHYWKKLERLPTTPPARVDPEARAAIAASMPRPLTGFRVARREGGLGSLGRPRFVGMGDWHGGAVAREAKALAPSALVWAEGGRSTTIHYEALIERAVRAPDPVLHVAGRWVVRRMAPHCARIELSDLPDRRDEYRLLVSMGFETANNHLGTKGARARIARELRGLDRRWLHQLTETLVDATLDDWRAFRADRGR
jgi:uncharacterized protein (DUF2252 family)